MSFGQTRYRVGLIYTQVQRCLNRVSQRGFETGSDRVCCFSNSRVDRACMSRSGITRSGIMCDGIIDF